MLQWLQTLLLAALVLGLAGEPVSGHSRSHASIVFVSCNKHDYSQQYWDTIANAVPGIVCNQSAGKCVEERKDDRLDALVWLGDVVYADTPLLPGVWVRTPLDKVKQKYEIQAAHPEYRAFLAARSKRTLGVWDDHDFGQNDGGIEFEDKDAIQQYFLDFLGEPKSSPRRKQQGLYSFTTIPFAQREVDATLTSGIAAEVENAFCLILLDVRYFREPLTADRSGDMLGEIQWKWLERILVEEIGPSGSVQGDEARRGGKQSCGAVLIGSGVQFLMDEKPTEQWGNFPKSRNKLLRMLRKHRIPRVVFLTGDVHLGEVGIDDTDNAKRTLGYPLVDATSSGLTHSSASIPFVPDLFLQMFPTSRRRGVFLGRNFGSISLFGDELRTATLVLKIHSLEPSTFRSSTASTGADSQSVPIAVEIPLRTLCVPLDTVDEEAGTFAETEFGTVKKILVGTQRYVFPNAKFHQLINMYVIGALVVIGLSCCWVAWCFVKATIARWGARKPQHSHGGTELKKEK